MMMMIIIIIIIIIINVICLTITSAKYNNKHWPVSCKPLLAASISKMCKPTNQHSHNALQFLHLFQIL